MLIDHYVKLVDQGHGVQARAEVAAGSGKREMDRFRNAVTSYERAERSRDDATSRALARAWATMHELLVWGTLVAVATSVLLYLTLSRSIITRLKGLQRNAHTVAAGQMPRLSIVGDDEITRVERSFLEMALLLSKREDALVRANSLQRAVIDGTDHAIITTDTTGTVTSFNGGAARMLGYTAEQVVGCFTPERFHLAEELAARALGIAQEVGRPIHAGFEVLIAKVQQDQIEQREWTFVRADGTRLPVWTTVTPLQDDAGEVFGYVGVSEDISQRKAAEQAIVQSELEQREYALQLRSLHLIANTVATAQREPIFRSLRLGLEQLGLEWAYVGIVDDVGTSLVIDKSVGAGEEGGENPLPAGASIAVHEAFIGQAPRSSEVYTGVPTFARPQAYIVAPIYVSGSLYGAVGFLGSAGSREAFSSANRDFVRVTADLVGAAIEREQQNARLDELAFFDALTGLPNRVLFLDRLTQTVLAAKRHSEVFALLYLDLDGFKAVNDTYGHGAGDEVLKAASRRFESLMRTSDTVARLGGDEFVILAPKLGNALDASDLAARVVKSMHRPIVLGDVEHALTVSVGISVFPHDGLEAGTLIDSADRALYASKAKGKNKFTFASNSVLPTAERSDVLRTVGSAA